MNDSILLIYKSVTGFTKRYAQWIAEETGCTLSEYHKRMAEQMAPYDTVIFASRAHAGRIDGLPDIRRQFQQSGARRLILCVTGAMPGTAGNIIDDFWKQNLTEEEQKAIPHFYMPGGLCYERMPLTDRLIMKAAAAMIRRKKDKSDQDRQMEQAIRGSYDISSKEFIRPLMAYLKKA